MPQEYVDKGVFRKKPTYSEILSSIERDEDKIQLPERTALTFWDSFAMGQYKEMLETAAAGTQAHRQAITKAVGISRAASLRRVYCTSASHCVPRGSDQFGVVMGKMLVHSP